MSGLSMKAAHSPKQALLEHDAPNTWPVDLGWIHFGPLSYSAYV